MSESQMGCDSQLAELSLSLLGLLSNLNRCMIDSRMNTCRKATLPLRMRGKYCRAPLLRGTQGKGVAITT